ncbi:glycoside hydrolase [Diplogelasinospora grovesii]|uniref:Glycoside hydrolase n=1 Tax=Diplogelasinospora grovesii TaxID=303347 RepID=A0AAN6RZ79_9PEZI|nr:glycoside hydrolase [Diplogelasinospora grovesii]
MRLLIFFTWCLALSRAQEEYIRSAKDPQIPPIYPIGTTKEPFVKVDGRLFNIAGKTGYFAGTNAWWLGHLTNNTDVDTAMQQISNTGYKIVRVWGFGDVNTPIPDNDNNNDTLLPDPRRVWFQLINSTTQSSSYINYGPSGLQRLDYVVHVAERLGLKLSPALCQQLGTDWGGFDAYDPNWFLDPDLPARLRRVPHRSWSAGTEPARPSSPGNLCNEPRCPLCNATVITDWAANISAYIKTTLDPDHMVTLGDEGWFAPGSNYTDVDGTMSYAYQANDDGVDFTRNLQISTLDYGVFHLYPNLWGYTYEWGSLWIRQHDDAGLKANKPVILEEYGSPFSSNHTPVLQPWMDTVLKETRLAADQIWQFGPADLSVDVALFGDEFSVYYNDTEFDVLGRRHARDMLDKKVDV